MAVGDLDGAFPLDDVPGPLDGEATGEVVVVGDDEERAAVVVQGGDELLRRGEVDVVLTVDNKPANLVRLNFK